VRPYLKKILLAEWLKVKALSSSPSTARGKKKKSPSWAYNSLSSVVRKMKFSIKMIEKKLNF
jgi:hypothetical protein